MGLFTSMANGVVGAVACKPSRFHSPRISRTTKAASGRSAGSWLIASEQEVLVPTVSRCARATAAAAPSAPCGRRRQDQDQALADQVQRLARDPVVRPLGDRDRRQVPGAAVWTRVVPTVSKCTGGRRRRASRRLHPSTAWHRAAPSPAPRPSVSLLPFLDSLRVPGRLVPYAIVPGLGASAHHHPAPRPRPGSVVRRRDRGRGRHRSRECASGCAPGPRHWRRRRCARDGGGPKIGACNGQPRPRPSPRVARPGPARSSIAAVLAATRSIPRRTGRQKGRCACR